MKRLLWITYGIPSQVQMTSGWQDLTQLLLELGSRFNRAGTVVYSLDPGINISGWLMNRDGLEILTASTGGVAFLSGDLPKAVAQVRNHSAFNYLLEYTPLTRDSPDHYRTVRTTSRRKGISSSNSADLLATCGKLMMCANVCPMASCTQERGRIQFAELLAAGIGIGLAFALMATRMAQSMLFGLKPYDARTFMLGAILLATVTLLASYLPVRRAARLEPMTALRED